MRLPVKNLPTGSHEKETLSPLDGDMEDKECFSPVSASHKLHTDFYNERGCSKNYYGSIIHYHFKKKIGCAHTNTWGYSLIHKLNKDA